MKGNGLIYSVREGDSYITQRVIREVNHVLIPLINSVGENSSEYLAKDIECEAIIIAARQMDALYNDMKINYSNVVGAMNTVINGGLLSPLTLTDSEFDYTLEEGYFINSRYDSIYKIVNQSFTTYGNTNAYRGIVKKGYSHDSKKEFVPAPEWIRTGTIYITMGGVTNGDYINVNSCQVKMSKDADYTYLTDVINIPVSVIQDVSSFELHEYYTMDGREPLFKLLCNLYNVSIYKDDSIKGKFDIRKYKKLSNEKVTK